MRAVHRSWRALAVTAGTPVRLAALLATAALVVPGVAAADTPDWATSAWLQALQVPVSAFFIPPSTPTVIPPYQAFPDATGLVASYQPGGPTTTADNAFFTALGTNGRTCFSCHQPEDGWALTPSSVRSTFFASDGLDPVFAAVDGADCPDLADDPPLDPCTHPSHQEHAEHFIAARHQLFSRANFRIFLPIPDGAEWKVRVKNDPYGCESSPVYGLPARTLSVYRRPLPSTNVSALDPQTPGAFNIMWDAREPSLESQFVDATRIHAQAPDTAPTAAQIAQGVSFQSGLFTAQTYDFAARDLDAAGAEGGARFLAGLDPGFLLPNGASFTIFDAWAALVGGGHQVKGARESIARGQALFNGKPFDIVDVSGLNELPGLTNPQPGSCSFCHGNAQRGNDFFLDPKRLGIEDNSCASPNTCGGSTPGARRALSPPPDMPLFSFLCPPGSIPFFSNPVWHHGVAYDELTTTDPGVGLISGKCQDLGKMKVPILRGLAARAPYFHGGNAATLDDLVDFYDQRFAIGFTDDEKRDLVHFLAAL